MIPSAIFKDGMRRLVSGVSLITAAHDGARRGTIVTSVSPVTAEPPTLLVCLNLGNSCHDAVAGSGAFCVNFLDRDAQALAARFASPQDREGRFDQGRWRVLATGAPALESALVNFDCRVQRRIRAGSHTIFLGEIADCRIADPRPALLYGEGTYGGFLPAAP